VSEKLADFMGSVDLIVEAGAVYAAALPCYREMLDNSHGNRPWLLFGPRGDVDTQPLWNYLQKKGYKIDDLSHVRAPYRRLLDVEDYNDIEERLKRLKKEPSEYLKDGWLYNDLVFAEP
jgi:hypothetical protein